VLAVAVVAEHRAVGEADVVVRVDRDELDVVFGLPPGELERVADEPGAVMIVGPPSKVKPSCSYT
jgi:hypothetical protein